MAEIKLFNRDCIAAMKDIEDGSIDLIVTDPPYNLGNFMKNRDTNLHKMRDNFFATAGWDDMEFDEWTQSMDAGSLGTHMQGSLTGSRTDADHLTICFCTEQRNRRHGSEDIEAAADRHTHGCCAIDRNTVFANTGERGGAKLTEVKQWPSPPP